MTPDPTGMQAVISALLDSTSGLTAAKMFSVVTDIVPFVVFMIPVALGIYFFRRLAKGAGRGKLKI